MNSTEGEGTATPPNPLLLPYAPTPAPACVWTREPLEMAGGVGRAEPRCELSPGLHKGSQPNHRLLVCPMISCDYPDPGLAMGSVGNVLRGAKLTSKPDQPSPPRPLSTFILNLTEPPPPSHPAPSHHLLGGHTTAPPPTSALTATPTAHHHVVAIDRFPGTRLSPEPPAVPLCQPKKKGRVAGPEERKRGGIPHLTSCRVGWWSVQGPVSQIWTQSGKRVQIVSERG